jgi:hypothetical protein
MNINTDARGAGGSLRACEATAKMIATATARAALLGIEARPLGTDAWLLRSAAGATIGTVQGADALLAAVAGFEAARGDVAALVGRMARGAAR